MSMEENQVQPMMFPVKMSELFPGAWIQVYNAFSGRFTPPAKITALFDDKTVYYSFGEDSGDPFEDEINLIHAIPVSEEMLRGFGFDVSEPTTDMIGSQVAHVYYQGKYVGVLFVSKHSPYMRVEFASEYEVCWTIHELLKTMDYYDIDISKIEWKGIE